MTATARIIVAKVGGSLLDWPPLPERLSRFLADRHSRGERIVLIAGGGQAADWVRALDRIYALGEERSHALAVRSLDLTAHALATLLPGAEVVETLDALPNSWRSGRVPVLAPRLLLDNDDRNAPDPLPRIWDTTTDAISARVATLLNADELVLLKSVGIPAGTTREKMAQLGMVDRMFPMVSRAISSVVVVNLRDGTEAPAVAG